MKILNILVCLVLVLFMVVQYNDPDGPLWMVIYAIPAIWTGIAAFRPGLLRRTPAAALLALCVLVAVAATAYYWPTMPHWWQQEVWWEQETAREGMGMMIVLIALLVASLGGWLSRSARVPQA